MSVLGENIKKLRKRAGLSQKELAEKANLGKSTINDIENEKNKSLKADTLFKIADALDTNIETLNDLELEHEYCITDVHEATKLILSQENLTLDGQPITSETRKHLENMFRMAIESARGIQQLTMV